MGPQTAGPYRLRWADTEADRARAGRLRHSAFARNPSPDGRDADRHDGSARSALIEDRAGRLAATFRLRQIPDAAALGQCYTAGVYDLSAIARQRFPMAELGRLCVDPARRDPAILRTALAGLAGIVDGIGVGCLFGCASFRGCDPAPYRDAFACLAARHLAAPGWRPGRRAAEVIPLATGAAAHDPLRALRTMPPLLRSYLAMGGRVSDHAVVDRDLGTLHVFTVLEVARIPSARKRFLRGAAQLTPA